MRQFRVWWFRLLVAFLCGMALGFLMSTFNSCRFSMWLQQTLKSTVSSENDYDDEWPSLVTSDSPEDIVTTPVVHRHNPECNHTIADSLVQRVRVLCWVMTQPKNHATKAAAVYATWGRHCNKLLFMSSKHDHKLPTVALNISEGRDHLWDKTKAALKYIVHEGLLENTDWVLKADDDTFIVMENLRYLLLPLNSSEIIFLGLRLQPLSLDGYMSGGAGYVLSQMAAHRFVEKGMSGGITDCNEARFDYEDVSVGRCLTALNATFLDSRDSNQLERFHAYHPEQQMAPIRRMAWLKRFSYYPLQPASKCCSPDAVSFHYIKPAAMRSLYYLVYRLKPYGLNECALPAS